MLAIFPGHVGKDSGAVVSERPYAMESHINAVISSMLYSDLMIREEEKINPRLYVGSLRKRVKEANDDDCKLGISIHCDAMPTHLKDYRRVNGAHMITYSHNSRANMLAEKIKDNWNYGVGVKMRDNYLTHRKDLSVLRNTKFPVVLLECGFLTNLSDRKALSDVDNLDWIASIIGYSVVDLWRRYE